MGGPPSRVPTGGSSIVRGESSCLLGVALEVGGAVRAAGIATGEAAWAAAAGAELAAFALAAAATAAAAAAAWRRSGSERGVLLGEMSISSASRRPQAGSFRQSRASRAEAAGAAEADSPRAPPAPPDVSRPAADDRAVECFSCAVHIQIH